MLSFPADQEHRFYSVSMGKLSLLYFVVGEFFVLFWFYRLWKDIEIKTGKAVFPVIRALFSFFFVHQLFAHIKAQESLSETSRQWDPNGLAWFYVLVNAVKFAVVLALIQYRSSHLMVFVVGVVFLVLQFYAVYQAQLAVNRAAGDPYGKKNASLTLENKLWMVFGVYIWLKQAAMTTQPLPDPAAPLDGGAAPIETTQAKIE